MHCIEFKFASDVVLRIMFAMLHVRANPILEEVVVAGEREAVSVYVFVLLSSARVSDVGSMFLSNVQQDSPELVNVILGRLTYYTNAVGIALYPSKTQFLLASHSALAFSSRAGLHSQSSPATTRGAVLPSGSSFSHACVKDTVFIVNRLPISSLCLPTRPQPKRKVQFQTSLRSPPRAPVDSLHVPLAVCLQPQFRVRL